ncbi:STI1 domain-containing protein [Caenorhabditis elegans]|uniref:STI1 domain-containing protein n=1 Tax=Caenorhabditis elegans TaxID=6239 RepID=A0A5S9MNS5_CAEEL|nr:STI1 domain-containing protein [Caenorhabditis elegans]CAA0059145.1 STI1 domain-containing protein [Caenorhabditis elegans]
MSQEQLAEQSRREFQYQMQMLQQRVLQQGQAWPMPGAQQLQQMLLAQQFMMQQFRAQQLPASFQLDPAAPQLVKAPVKKTRRRKTTEKPKPPQPTISKEAPENPKTYKTYQVPQFERGETLRHYLACMIANLPMDKRQESLSPCPTASRQSSHSIASILNLEPPSDISIALAILKEHETSVDLCRISDSVMAALKLEPTVAEPEAPRASMGSRKRKSTPTRKLSGQFEDALMEIVDAPPVKCSKSQAKSSQKLNQLLDSLMERASSFQAAEPQAAEPQAAVPIATEPQENSEFEQFLKSAMEIARSSESSVSPENGDERHLANVREEIGGLPVENQEQESKKQQIEL